MKIATYLQDLLYRYECVILPGFGAFLSQRQSAFIDADSEEFFPPKKVISFNRQLFKNDGLLANYIASVENIDYDIANAKIGEFVNSLEKSLKAQDKVELANIGKLFLDSEDRVQFEPATNINFLTTSFGLHSFGASQVSRELYKEQVEKIEEKAPVYLTPEKRSSVWMKYAAIGLLAMGLSGFAGLNIYSNQVSQHNIAEQQDAEHKLEEQIQQATFVIDNPLPAITFQVEKQEGNYHVIAGAFRVKENAEKRVSELKVEGHTARLLGENKYGLHQVVYSSYENRREAIKKLYQVKNSNEGAWLLFQQL